MADDKKQTLTFGAVTVGVTPVEIVERRKEQPNEYELEDGAVIRVTNDFHGWLLDQAAALRNRNTLRLDWEHLAEELEAMAAAERRELLRRLTTLFEHLLKLNHQVEEVSRRGRQWRLTVTRTRTEIKRLLAQSPSLKGQLNEFVIETYADARAIAGEAMGLPRHQWQLSLPQENPWTVDQALADDFFPAD
jgi:hypothetical protein